MFVYVYAQMFAWILQKQKPKFFFVKCFNHEILNYQIDQTSLLKH